MTREPDGLADLLPQWHRLRDAEGGEPLRALLAVIAEQADRVRDGVEQGYEDWFVETAAPWVLPYLGDLVGYSPLPGYERVQAQGLEGERGTIRACGSPRPWRRAAMWRPRSPTGAAKARSLSSRSWPRTSPDGLRGPWNSPGSSPTSSR